MTYKVEFEKSFKKHYKRILSGGRYNKLDFAEVYFMLVNENILPSKYNDHALVNRKPERELHIKPDWLLIYKYDGQYIKFIDTGSHSDLFK